MHAGIPPRVGPSSFFIAEDFPLAGPAWVGKPLRIASWQS
jgi:hypothetical protein